MCAIYREWPTDTITLYANIDMMPFAVEHPEHHVQGGGEAIDGRLGIVAIEGGEKGWLRKLWRVMMVKA